RASLSLPLVAGGHGHALAPGRDRLQLLLLAVGGTGRLGPPRSAPGPYPYGLPASVVATRPATDRPRFAVCLQTRRCRRRVCEFGDPRTRTVRGGREPADAPANRSRAPAGGVNGREYHAQR